MIITIDGPAAAGKSTLAKNLARTLGFIYLNSGSLYRAIALYKKTHSETDMIPELGFTQDGNILLENKDVEELIHTDEISMMASDISKDIHIRQHVNALLVEMAKQYPDVIAEGRDMGSSVFPHADVKIYLTADISTRAKRRCTDPTQYDKTLESLTQRDRNDSERSVSPLRIPDNAIIIDNSDMSENMTLATALAASGWA